MSDQSWLRLWQTIFAALVALIWGTLAFNAVQMHTLVAANYCERAHGNGWIRCDLLKDVVEK